MKRLILVLGDQLDINSGALRHLDKSTDQVIMIESKHESDYVWSHKAKIAIFLSAMRHFAQDLIAQQIPLIYLKESHLTIQDALRAQLIEKSATHLICTEPGEWRLKQAISILFVARTLLCVRNWQANHLFGIFTLKRIALMK